MISAFRSVGFHPSTAEVTAVCQRYGDGRLLTWKLLCAEVEPTPAPPPKPAVSESAREEPSLEIVQFMQRISQAVERCGTSLRSEFLGVDVRKVGVLSSQVFKGVLDSLAVRTSLSEISGLLKQYFKPKTDMIVYGVFCDDLELFGKAPPPVPRPRIVIPTKDEKDIERSEQALRLLKAALGCRRLHGEELFIGHDSARMGTIPIETLVPATKAIAPFLSDEVVEQIKKDFRDRRQPERFNYRRLCAILGSVVATQEDIEQVIEHRREVYGENENVEPVLVTIKGKLTERRKTIYELFINVTSDGIPVTQFRNRIGAAGIALSEADAQKLVWKYKTRIPNEIDWRAFCADVEEARSIRLR
jgi:hypothetical protein